MVTYTIKFPIDRYISTYLRLKSDLLSPSDIAKLTYVQSTKSIKACAGEDQSAIKQLLRWSAEMIEHNQGDMGERDAILDIVEGLTDLEYSS